MSESLSDASTRTPTNWDQRVAGKFGHSIHQLDFFQAIRRIEGLAGSLPRVGHARQAHQEAVRIRQTTALDFAPATIDRIDSPADGRAHLSQRFFGLLGPGGPLPLQMTETVRHETRHESDPALEAFLNLFHHRMAMLFYRAWSSSRGAVQRDRPDQDRFASYVGAISGVMPMSGRGTGEDNRLYFSGRLASSHRNAEGLAAIVSATVQADAKIKTFRLRNLRLEPEDLSVLSRSSSKQGRGGRLGQSIVLGRSVPDRRSMIDLDIGPIVFDLFQTLLPGESGHDELRDLIRSYIDPGLDCRVRLILDRRTMPRMSLSRTGSAGHVGSLGRSAWINSSAPQSDAGDCQFII
ncbi:type VI secretion system baseplate subunit TssG [Rubripirellula reticaptiva]|uniref:Type VI secretion protein n=1 Tax=Rubripirellula reticaptiva TaxID=2528013 RepID=A0A5C6F851_9BACT|nr:type VI secretion system baseplate subunit TssG [Rubripirellula reticaptiva]TWU56286.1 hypothetical protein Poly59_25900 [Rubripirellula reticaptiva]